MSKPEENFQFSNPPWYLRSLGTHLANYSTEYSVSGEGNFELYHSLVVYRVRFPIYGSV